MRYHLIDRGEADEDVDDFGDHRTLPTEDHADIPARQPNQKPVEASDDEQNEGDCV